MFKKIRKRILKRVYKFLIYKTILLDKKSIAHYDKLETFCALDVSTNKGIFKFIFKKDRRIHRRADDVSKMGAASYIIELLPPDTLSPIEDSIKNKIVIVIKIMFFKPNYEILTELLVDTYLDTILDYISNGKEEGFVDSFSIT